MIGLYHVVRFPYDFSIPQCRDLRLRDRPEVADGRRDIVRFLESGQRGLGQEAESGSLMSRRACTRCRNDESAGIQVDLERFDVTAGDPEVEVAGESRGR